MTKLLDQVLQANIYIQPIQLSISITVNIINICVLSSRILRSSPCTHYFLAYAIFSTVYTCLVCPTHFLHAFHIDWTNGNIGCKINSYILFLIPFQANLMLILASFDRYCSSSQSRRFHSKTTIRSTRITIIISTILSIIYMSPMLFIYYWNDISTKCIIKYNILIFTYICSQVFFYYILTPILMFVFGLLTINNIHQRSNRAIPLTSSIRGRRTEAQLGRMLFLQVTVHLILVLPFGIAYTINSFIPSTRTSTMKAIRFVFVMWQQCDYFVSFFLYVLSGNIYRRQLIKILKSIKCYNTHKQTFIQKKKSIYQALPLISTTTK